MRTMTQVINTDIVEIIAELFTRRNTVTSNLHSANKLNMDVDCNKLFERAKMGDDSIIEHPMVSKYKGVYGNTPLHRLAVRGCVKVLEHPDSYTVVNDLGITPVEYYREIKKMNKRKGR